MIRTVVSDRDRIPIRESFALEFQTGGDYNRRKFLSEVFKLGVDGRGSNGGRITSRKFYTKVSDLRGRILLKENFPLE